MKIIALFRYTIRDNTALGWRKDSPRRVHCCQSDWTELLFTEYYGLNKNPSDRIQLLKTERKVVEIDEQEVL